MLRSWRARLDRLAPRHCLFGVDGVNYAPKNSHFNPVSVFFLGTYPTFGPSLTRAGAISDNLAMNDSKDIQRAIVKLRRTMSQQRLAELVGVSQPTISRWESGARMPPAALAAVRLVTLARIGWAKDA